MYAPILKENWHGRGASKKTAEAVNRLARCLNNLRGLYGVTIEPNEAGGLDFYGAGGGPAGFSGIVYVSGKRHVVTSLIGPRLRVIKSTVAGATVSRTTDPMPDPMPANESWRELSQCSGDIYIDC